MNVRFPPKELEALDAWIANGEGSVTRPSAVRKLVKLGIGRPEAPKHHARMAPLKSEPPGMERDNRGNAIPLKKRTKDDQERANLGKIARAKPKKK